MNFRLLYDDQIIADVAKEGLDFPTFFGRYTLIKGLDQKPEFSRLLSYIDYSVRVWPLIEADEIEKINYDEEAQFIDLIESGKWWMVDRNGEKIGILIPVFCTDYGINWRLDTDR